MLYESPERLGPRLTPRAKRPARPSVISEVFRDYWLIAILIFAFLVNLGLATFLLIRFEGMNELVPLHFDAQGLPDRIESKNGIYGLPVIGFVILLGNAFLALLAHRRERAASLLLVASALMVEILLWLAALNIAA